MKAILGFQCLSAHYATQEFFSPSIPTVLLLQALFPWGCVGSELDDTRSHPTFAHAMPRPTRVLLSIVTYFRWAHIAIISSSDATWVETATKV